MFSNIHNNYMEFEEKEGRLKIEEIIDVCKTDISNYNLKSSLTNNELHRLNNYIDEVLLEENYNNKDTLVFRHEGYFQNGHIKKEQHLIKSWCELLGLEYTNQTPVLLPNLVQQRMTIQWQREKPIMLIQTNGGPLDDNRIYNWTRDMPVGISSLIVNEYSKDYHIIQICRNEKEAIPGVEAIYQPLSNFELITALAVSQKRVLIDSSLQHAAAALNLPSTVLWVGTSPKMFGYDMHSNIIANPPKYKPKLINSYLFDYSFEGSPTQCPYANVLEMSDLEKLNESIKNT